MSSSMKAAPGSNGFHKDEEFDSQIATPVQSATQSAAQPASGSSLPQLMAAVRDSIDQARIDLLHATNEARSFLGLALLEFPPVQSASTPAPVLMATLRQAAEETVRAYQEMASGILDWVHGRTPAPVEDAVKQSAYLPINRLAGYSDRKEETSPPATTQSPMPEPEQPEQETPEVTIEVVQQVVSEAVEPTQTTLVTGEIPGLPTTQPASEVTVAKKPRARKKK